MENYIRQILPKMVSLSNNSRLTNEVAISLSEKLSQEEFHQFQEWLKLIESNQQIQRNHIKRF